MRMKATTGVMIAVGAVIVVGGITAAGLYVASRAADRAESIQQRVEEQESPEGIQGIGAPSKSSSASKPTVETTLADGVDSGLIEASAAADMGYASADLTITNLTDGTVSVDVNGTILDSNNEGVQRLGISGVDPDAPPADSKPETPEEMIERIKREIHKRLEDANKRVKDGDRSEDALRDLLKEIGEGQKVGDESADDAMETVQDAQAKNAEDAYNEFKNNPTDANKKAALDELARAQALGGNEDATEGMVDDVINTPTQNPPSKPAPSKPTTGPAPEPVPYTPPAPPDPNVS